MENTTLFNLSNDARKLIGWPCVLVFLIFLISPAAGFVENYLIYALVMTAFGLPLAIIGFRLIKPPKPQNEELQERPRLSSKRRKWSSVAFIFGASLLGIWIFGVSFYHGAESPFNTGQGKFALTGIFVGLPCYLFARVHRASGIVALGVSIFLWTAGQNILIKSVLSLAP